ncbi:MAG: DMT family transporter [Pseudomonadota bacterium]
MSQPFQIVCLTALAMVAFAANSVLARLALIGGEIGPWSFTLIRVASGAACLFALAGRRAWPAGSWTSSAALLAYAGFFSFAYLALDSGMGALILFAVVQITMLGWGLARGETLTPVQSLGAVSAFGGLVWLVSPGAGAPVPVAAAAMAVAGAAWGVYSLRGRGGGDPIAATAGNFVRAALIAVPLSLAILPAAPEPAPNPFGIGLALTSGVLTSGAGYAIWYKALKHLSAIRAGLAQLTVPAIAALGGVVFLGEAFTLRFGGASLLILGGVALATAQPRSRSSGKLPEATND